MSDHFPGCFPKEGPVSPADLPINVWLLQQGQDKLHILRRQLQNKAMRVLVDITRYVHARSLDADITTSDGLGWEYR